MGDNVSFVAFDHIKEWLLTAHPNPERIGCFPPEVLRDLAEKRLPADHPAVDHLEVCSPCYQEFSILLDARRAVEREERRRVLRIAGGLLLACLLLLTVWRMERHGFAPPPLPLIATWNLRSGMRGDTGEQKSMILEAPARKGRVALVQPYGSDAGQYEIQIRRNHNDSPLQTFMGIAVMAERDTKLQFEADLSRIPPGSYFVAFRRVNALWHSAPLVVQ